MDFPAANSFSVPVVKTDLLDTTAAARFNAFLEATKTLMGASAPEEVTISGGQITPTKSTIIVDTEAMASLDLLTRISLTNIRDGQFIAIFPKSESRKIKVVPNLGAAGKIILLGSGSVLLDKLGKGIFLRRSGQYFYECAFRASSLYSTIGGIEGFNASGTFTVPDGITQIWIDAIAGGGGGGGGGASDTGGYGTSGIGGSDGSAGGDTVIGTITTCTGGTGGAGASVQGAGGFGLGAIGGVDGESVYSRSDIAGLQRGRGGIGPQTAFGTYGKGGNGGGGGLGVPTCVGGGGGSGCPGQMKKDYTAIVEPLQEITITIGAGGAGGAGGVGTTANGGAGPAGNAGYVTIRW